MGFWVGNIKNEKWAVGRLMRNAAVLPVLAGACLSATAANAASGNGQSRTSINRSVTITKNADLHFGNFAAGTSQSRFRIEPEADTLTQLSGNAIPLGGTRTAASFTAIGRPLERVRITVNQNQIDLIRVGGTQTMRVDQFRLDGGNGTRNRFLNAGGSVNYKVGGRLTIAPNQAGGAYVGSFNVTIDYQ